MGCQIRRREEVKLGRRKEKGDTGGPAHCEILIFREWENGRMGRIVAGMI